MKTNRSERRAHVDPRPVCREPERATARRPKLSRLEKRAIKEKQQGLFEGVK